MITNNKLKKKNNKYNFLRIKGIKLFCLVINWSKKLKIKKKILIKRKFLILIKNLVSLNLRVENFQIIKQIQTASKKMTIILVLMMIKIQIKEELDKEIGNLDNRLIELIQKANLINNKKNKNKRIKGAIIIINKNKIICVRFNKFMIIQKKKIYCQS